MIRIVVTAALGVALVVGAVYRMYNNRSQLREFHEIPVSHVNSSDRDNCPICLLPMDERTTFLLACRHKLHKACASILFIEQEMKSCPICRKVLNIDFKKQLYSPTV